MQGIQKQLNLRRSDQCMHPQQEICEETRETGAEGSCAAPWGRFLGKQVSLRNFVSVATVVGVAWARRRTMTLFHSRVLDRPCGHGTQHLVAIIQHEAAHRPGGLFIVLPSKCRASVLDERRPCVGLDCTRPNLRLLDGLARPAFDCQ